MFSKPFQFASCGVRRRDGCSCPSRRPRGGQGVCVWDERVRRDTVVSGYVGEREEGGWESVEGASHTENVFSSPSSFFLCGLSLSLPLASFVHFLLPSPCPFPSSPLNLAIPVTLHLLPLFTKADFLRPSRLSPPFPLPFPLRLPLIFSLFLFPSSSPSPSSLSSPSSSSSPTPSFPLLPL